MEWIRRKTRKPVINCTTSGPREPNTKRSLLSVRFPSIDRFRDGQENLLCQVVGIGVLQTSPTGHSYHHWPFVPPLADKLRENQTTKQHPLGLLHSKSGFVRFRPMVHLDSSVSNTQNPICLSKDFSGWASCALEGHRNSYSAIWMACQ